MCDDSGTATVNGLCFPATGSGDQGSAIGTVTFADVPVDEAQVTVDGVVYEFDLTDGATCGNTAPEDVCMNASTAEDGANAAALLVASDTGGDTGATMYSRGNVVYIYADTAGAAGNSLGVSETDDTGNDITPIDTTGGDDDNASPFAINHAPNLVDYAAGDTAGASGLNHATGTIEPGDTVYFSAQITDADEEDAQDTVNMYVCNDGASFTPGTGCGADDICSVTGVDPTSEYAECSTTALTTVPTANATYDVEVFIEDQHEIQGTYSGGDSGRQYTVTDVAPYLDGTYGGGDGYIATDTPAPSAGDSDDADFSFRIIDNNGDNDIQSARGVFFLSSAGSSCSADENNCYIDADCTLDTASTPGASGTKTADGTDALRVASCTVTVWFNATAGTWYAAGFATDEADEEGPFTTSTDSITVGTLAGIDVVQTEIAYSTVAIGGTSNGIETSIGNVGNDVLDVVITGTDMSDGGTNTIAAAQQKWHSNSGTFDWDASPDTHGPWVLLNSAGSSAYDETEGCANRDIAVRNDHTATTTNESVYWKIRIPNAQAAGAYTGSNTFSSAASSYCSGGTLH